MIKRENIVNSDNRSFFRRVLQNIAGWFVVLLALLLPVKFGSLAVMPEAAGFFPTDVFSWLIINWPAHSFGIFSGTALILCLAGFPIPNLLTVRGITAMLWGIGLPLSALAGVLSANVRFYADSELYHIAGCSAFCLAAFLVLSSDETRWQKRISSALTAGVLLLCLTGLRQYFFGFAEMREFIAQQQAKGIYVGRVMLAKVADTRVYAAMVSANVLAGFLLLTVPFTAVCFRKAGFRFEPVKLSTRLFLAAALLAGISVFLMTKTRAAFLCALVTAAFYVFTLKFPRIFKILLLLLSLLTAAGGAYYIKTAGRGFGSLEERFDYMRTSMIMLPEKPLTGHGWGEFFYRHMKEKTTSTDESAHDPHNIFLSFALHCGIPAGLLVCGCFLFPLIILFRRRDTAERSAVFWGSFAFTLHCCCDINMQIPACLAGQGLLFLLALPDQKITEKIPQNKLSVPLKVLFFILAAAVGVLAAAGNRNWLRGEVVFTAFSDEFRQPSGRLPDERLLREHWNTLEKLRPGYPFACLLFGDYSLATGNISNARKFFTEAAKRDPRRPAVYRRLAQIAEREGDFQTQKMMLKKAHELFPSHPEYKLDKTAPTDYINGGYGIR